MAAIKISGIGAGDSSFTANITSTATFGDSASDRIVLNGTSAVAANLSGNSISSNAIIHTPTNTVLTPFVGSAVVNTAIGASHVVVSGIPSWATTITMCWNNLVTVSTAAARVRIGSGGTVLTGGYYNFAATNSGGSTSGTATNTGDGMSQVTPDAGTAFSGWAILQKIPSELDSTSSTYGDTWILNGANYFTSTSIVINWVSGVWTSTTSGGLGLITPLSPLDTVGIGWNGTSTFNTNTGTLRVFWE